MIATSFLVIFLLSGAIVDTIHALSSGAPGGAGCVHLTPNHGPGIYTQNLSTSPFTIDLSEFAEPNVTYLSYKPGEIYDITLKAKDPVDKSKRFRGFIIQGRKVKDDSKTVGQFLEPDTGRFHSCEPRHAGVTHNLTADPEGKKNGYDSLTFMWKAPPAGTGPIIFRYTVAINFTTFWANVKTDMIFEGECKTSGSETVIAAVNLLLVATVICIISLL